MTLCSRPWPRRNNLAETASVVPSGGGCEPLVHADGGGPAVLPLTVDRDGPAYRMELPARTVRTLPEPPDLSAALGITPVETATDGNNYLALPPGAADVRSLEPNLAAIAQPDRTGVGQGDLLRVPGLEAGGELVCRVVGDRVQLHGSCMFYVEGHIELWGPSAAA